MHVFTVFFCILLCVFLPLFVCLFYLLYVTTSSSFVLLFIIVCLFCLCVCVSLSERVLSDGGYVSVNCVGVCVLYYHVKFSLCIPVVVQGQHFGLSNRRSTESRHLGLPKFRGAKGLRFGLPKCRSANIRHFGFPNVGISDLRSRQQRNLSYCPVYKSQRVPVQFSLLLELAWGGYDFILSIKIAINHTTFNPCSLLQRACSSTSCIQNPQVITILWSLRWQIGVAMVKFLNIILY